ncbi:MAG: hypothetical protein HPY67_07425 [Syntrophaceae bacterium]|nr:hypothetical protein [Syntrophaceae bacterium]
MYPRLERFLAAVAVTALVLTAAFWAFPPELRFPDPHPATPPGRPAPAEAPLASAPAAPAPAPPAADAAAPPVRNEPPVPVAAAAPEETGPGLSATVSLSLRERLPEASLSDEDVRELTETIQSFRESMRGLRETERTAENADRIRELMARIEENRLRIEKTTGMSINEFLRRMTTEGIDNDRREEERPAAGAPDRPGR